MKSTSKQSSKKLPQVVPTQAEAEAKFIRSINKPSEGANSYVERFVQVASYIMDTARSFTFSDIARMSYQAEIPYEETRQLFKKWSDIMVQCGRLDMIEGAYDQPTYIRQF